MTKIEKEFALDHIKNPPKWQSDENYKKWRSRLNNFLKIATPHLGNTMLAEIVRKQCFNNNGGDNKTLNKDCPKARELVEKMDNPTLEQMFEILDLRWGQSVEGEK